MVNNRDKLLGAINHPFLKATILECMQGYPADSVRWSDVYVKLKIIEHLSLTPDSRLQKIEQIPNKIDEVLKKHTADIEKSAKTTSYSVINSTIQSRLGEEVLKPTTETLNLGLGKAHDLVNNNYSNMTKLLKQDNIKKMLTIVLLALGIWGGFVWGRHDAKQTKYSKQFEQ